jgi:hypothetical protein
MSVPVDLNLLNPRRIQEESTFNANAIGGDAAHGKIAIVATITQANDSAADDLHTLTTLADINADVNCDIIANMKFGLFFFHIIKSS